MAVCASVCEREKGVAGEGAEGREGGCLGGHVGGCLCVSQCLQSSVIYLWVCVDGGLLPRYFSRISNVSDLFNQLKSNAIFRDRVSDSIRPPTTSQACGVITLVSE